MRHPASFCGVVGLKPSYGLVPRHGLLSYASSLDCPGVITRSVMDSAVVLDAIAGSDCRDPSALQGMPPYADYCSRMGNVKTDKCGSFAIGPISAGVLKVAHQPAVALNQEQLSEHFDAFCRDSTTLSGVNIGIPEEFSVDGLNSEVLNAWEETVKMLVDAGATIRPVSLPSIKLALPCYYVLACAEASSNLSRYDGVRYGYKSSYKNSKQAFDSVRDQASEIFARDLRQTRGDGFGPEVIRRILTGTFVLSQNAYHDYFETAAKCRCMIREELNKCLSGSSDNSIHALLGPTAPLLPFTLDSAPDSSSMLLNDLYTIPANLAGVPAVTLPVGRSFISGGKQAVPIGMQFIGRFRDESRLLQIARAVETRANFISVVPDWLKAAYSSKE